MSLLCASCASYKINSSLDLGLSKAASSLASKSELSLSDNDEEIAIYHPYFKKNEQKLKQIFGSSGDYKIIINKFRYEDKYPQGFQCFEPLLFVISIGIIPVVCNNNIILEIDLINTKTGEIKKESIKYKDKYVAGWVGLFLRVFKDWNYDDENKLNAIYTVVNKISEEKYIKSN